MMAEFMCSRDQLITQHNLDRNGRKLFQFLKEKRNRLLLKNAADFILMRAIAPRA
jgi:hypothetical protein